MNRILNKYVTKKIINDCFNKDYIANFLEVNLTGDSLETLLELYFMETVQPLVKKGSYFKLNYDSDAFYSTISYDLDKMQDMGLYKDGYIYGKIIDSSNWGEFNPYFESMKTVIFVNNDYELLEIERNIKTIRLELINKSEIPYFNGNHIKKLTDTISTGLDIGDSKQTDD